MIAETEPDFIPPIHIPMQRLQVTYRAPFLNFLGAAQEAAGLLAQPKQPQWQVDGYRSDTLFLICRYPAGGGMPCQITAEFELDFTDDTVTVGVFSRWDRDLAFYRQFIWHLDMLLPRRLA